MKISINLSSDGNLLALINDANPGRNFTSNHILVKSVVARIPDEFPYNTLAIMEGKPDSRFKGTQTVYYDRRPLLEAVLAPQQVYPVTRDTTVTDLFNTVCTALKLVPSDLELVDFRTRIDEVTSIMTLRPITNARLYYNTFDVILFWTGEDVTEEASVLGIEYELNRFINVIMPSHNYT